MNRPRKSDNFERCNLRLVWQVLPIVAGVLVGCAAPPPAYTVKSSDPTAKIPAIRIAVQNGDQSVVPELIKDLESDDPAVRFYANNGLKKLTGQDLGFHYYADDHSRESAVKRWQAWLAESHRPATAKLGADAQAGGGADDIGSATGAPGSSTTRSTIGPSTQDAR